MISIWGIPGNRVVQNRNRRRFGVDFEVDFEMDFATCVEMDLEPVFGNVRQQPIGVRNTCPTRYQSCVSLSSLVVYSCCKTLVQNSAPCEVQLKKVADKENQSPHNNKPQPRPGTTHTALHFKRPANSAAKWTPGNRDTALCTCLTCPLVSSWACFTISLRMLDWPDVCSYNGPRTRKVIGPVGKHHMPSQ